MRKRVILITVILAVVAAVAVLYTTVTTKMQTPTTIRPENISATPEIVVTWSSGPLIPTRDLVMTGLYARVYSWRDYVRGAVITSPDGRLVVVAAQNYKVYIFNASSGRLLKVLEYEIGEIPRVVVFTPDGKYLIVGLCSKTGLVVVYDTKTWTERLRIELADFVKGPSNATPSTIYKRPWLGVCPYHIIVSPDGKIMYLTVNERYVKPDKQTPRYVKVTVDLASIYPEVAKNYAKYIVTTWTTLTYARLVGIDLDTGRAVFRWPEDDVAYISLPIVAVHPSGRYVAVASFYGFAPVDPARWHGGKVWVIDTKTGEVVYEFDPAPMVPILNRTTIWNGLAFTPDGKYLVVVTCDARVFLINHTASVRARKPVVVWSLELEVPVKGPVMLIPRRGGESKVVRGYLYTFGGLAGVTDRYILVYTSATYSTVWVPGYERKPVMCHPNSTKLFIIDVHTGNIVYIDKFYGKPMYGKVVPFALRGCYLAASIGNDWVRSDASMAGVYVWWVCGKPRLIARFLTVQSGLGVPLDVDMYDNRVYVVTGPIDLATSPEEPRRIVGEYKLVALVLTGRR